MFSSGYICFPLGTFLQHSYIFTSLYQHVKFNIYEKIDITINLCTQEMVHVLIKVGLNLNNHNMVNCSS